MYNVCSNKLINIHFKFSCVCMFLLPNLSLLTCTWDTKLLGYNFISILLNEISMIDIGV